MELKKIVEKARDIAPVVHGVMGLASGLISGAFIVRWYLKRPKDETELVVTSKDAARMLDDNVIAVYQTQYGPIFTAMSKSLMER